MKPDSQRQRRNGLKASLASLAALACANCAGPNLGASPTSKTPPVFDATATTSPPVLLKSTSQTASLQDSDCQSEVLTAVEKARGMSAESFTSEENRKLNRLGARVDVAMAAGNLASDGLTPPVLGVVGPVIGAVSRAFHHVRKDEWGKAGYGLLEAIPGAAAGFFGGGLAADGVQTAENKLLDAVHANKEQRFKTDIGSLVHSVRCIGHFQQQRTARASKSTPKLGG